MEQQTGKIMMVSNSKSFDVLRNPISNLRLPKPGKQADRRNPSKNYSHSGVNTMEEHP